ncbi:exported hypothetical protein [Syntrophobacter sp. SbD1]|nr:exported hypothetical protein [Syntrophobacter sp. SbD1]
MRRATFVLLPLVLATAGCSFMIPPQKIPTDRVNYLEAVSTSWKEQLLSNLVKLRYGDTLTSLEMTSVTTSYELDVGLSVGNGINWRAFRNTTGFHDTTSLGATAAYADKPSITYVPMKGDALSNTMLDPIAPAKILKNLQTATLETASLLPYCVKSINHLRCLSDPEFFVLAERFQELSQRGVIRITIKEKADPKVTTVPTDYNVTLDDKRHVAGTSAPVKKPGVKAGAELNQGNNCKESTDNKEEGKPAKAIALLVLDNGRAKSENKNGPLDLTSCASQSLDACAKSKNKEGCVTRLLSDSGIEAKNYPEGGSSFLMKCVTESLKSCPDSAKSKDCAIEHLNSCAEPVSLEEKVKRFKDLLFREENGYKQGDSHGNKCAGQYECYEIINGNEELPSDQFCGKIIIQTRSILQTLVLMSGLIEVKDDEKNAARRGLEENPSYESLKNFKIKSDGQRPSNAFVAIKYCGHWFYIDNSDIYSKIVFSSILGVLSMAETGTSGGVPILTLPVQ